VLFDRGAHPLDELLGVYGAARRPDDAELRWKEVTEGEGVERREELALGQVARGSEDREDA